MKVLTLISIATLSLTLFACGGGGGSDSGTTSSAPTTGGTSGGGVTTEPTVTVTTSGCDECKKSTETEVIKVVSDTEISAVDMSYDSGLVMVNNITVNQTGETTFVSAKDLSITFSAESAGDYVITLNKVKISGTWYDQNTEVNVTIIEDEAASSKVVINLEISALPNGIKLEKSDKSNDIIKGNLPENINVNSLTAHIIKYDITNGESEVYSSGNVELNDQSQVEFNLPLGHYSILLTAKFGDLTAVLFDFYEINNQLHTYIAAMQPMANNESVTLMESSYDSYSDGQQMPITWYNLLPKEYCTNYLYTGQNYGNVPQLEYNLTCLHDTQFIEFNVITESNFTVSLSSETINGFKTPLVVDIDGEQDVDFSFSLAKGNNVINTSFSNLPEESFDYSKFFTGNAGITSNNIYSTTIYVVE